MFPLKGLNIIKIIKNPKNLDILENLFKLGKTFLYLVSNKKCQHKILTIIIIKINLAIKILLTV